jgi:hypothetical protein
MSKWGLQKRLTRCLFRRRLELALTRHGAYAFQPALHLTHVRLTRHRGHDALGLRSYLVLESEDRF